MSRFTDFANAMLSSVPGEGIRNMNDADLGKYLSEDYAEEKKLLSTQRIEVVRPADASRKPEYRDISGSLSISKGLPLVSVFAAAVEKLLMEGRIRPSDNWSVRDLEYARHTAPFPGTDYAASLSSVTEMVRGIRGKKIVPVSSVLKAVDAFFRKEMRLDRGDDVDFAKLYNIVNKTRSSVKERNAFFDRFSDFIKKEFKCEGEGLTVDALSAAALTGLPMGMYEVMRGKVFRDAVADRAREASLGFITKEGTANPDRVFHDVPLGSRELVDWVKEREGALPILADSRVLPVCVPCAFFADTLEDALVMGEIAVSAFGAERLRPGQGQMGDLMNATHALTEMVWRYTHDTEEEKEGIVEAVCDKYGIGKPMFDLEALSQDAIGDTDVNYNPVRTLSCALSCAFDPSNANGVDALFNAARVGGDMPSLAYLTAALSEARFGRGAQEEAYVEELAHSHIAAFTRDLSSSFENVFVTGRRQKRVVDSEAERFSPTEKVKGLGDFVEKKDRSFVRRNMELLEGVRTVKAICFEGPGSDVLGMEPIFFFPDEQLDANAGKLMKIQLGKIYGHDVTLLPESRMDAVFEETKMRCHPEADTYMLPSEIGRSEAVGAYVETVRAYKDRLVVYDGTVEDLFHSGHPKVVEFRKKSLTDYRYGVFMSEEGFERNGEACMSFKQLADEVNAKFYRVLDLSRDAIGGNIVPLSAARVVLEHNEDGSLYFGLKRGDFKLGGFSLAPGGGIMRDYTMESIGEYLNSEYCMRHPFQQVRYYETALLKECLEDIVLDSGFGIHDDNAVVRSENRMDERAHYYESKGRGDYGDESFAARNADFYDRMAKLEDQGPDVDPLETRVLEPDGEHKSVPKVPNLELAQEDVSSSIDPALLRKDNVEQQQSFGLKI